MVDITDAMMRERIAGARQYVFVMLYVGPNYDPETSRPVIWEHGRRNMQLNDQGIMPIVCPMNDDTPLAGIAIFAAEPDRVAAIMDGDPGVEAGIFTYEIHPCRGFPGSTLP